MATSTATATPTTQTTETSSSGPDFTSFLNPQQRQKFEGLFNKFKKNGKDIPVQEVGDCLKEGGYTFAPSQIELIMKIVDTDASGTLDVDEFLGLVGYLTCIDAAFAEIDQDKNNKIERAELKRALTDVGYNFTDSQLESFFKMVDENNSGTVELKEFHTLTLFLRLARVLYVVADEDGNGEVEFSEFKGFLPTLGVTADESAAQNLFTSLDTSNKGYVSFEEFVNLVFYLLFELD